MQTNRFLSARLCSAVPYIRPAARVVDVGTDHAYLPIHLAEEGLVSAALAADINRGPIESARANIRAAGLESVIDTLQTDGLCGVEPFRPDHILIFGMGGELIVKILSRADWIRRSGIRLILQPMSRAAILRAWLIANGFSIVGETVTLDGKYYQTVVAEWSGVRARYSEAELLLGRQNIVDRSEHFEGFLRHELQVLERVIEGKRQSHDANTDGEEALKEELEALL